MPTWPTELDFQLPDKLVQVCTFDLGQQPTLTIVVVDDITTGYIANWPQELLLAPVHFHNLPLLFDITPGNVTSWRLMKHLHRPFDFLRRVIPCPE
ncbi:hypothetical protein WK70_13240 [Burkholderia cepacia]|nr:hypothetical protein WK70_13240 [Burkholderia cepacia]